MSDNRSEIIYEKLRRKGHVWYSIIKAIETATPKLRKKIKTSYDRVALSTISTQITKARREHSIFSTKLKEIGNQIESKTLSYYDIKNDLNELNNTAQTAIEKLRDIAKDIVDIKGINSNSTSTKTTQEQDIGPKPPTPPDCQSISDSSSPVSTMAKQRTEISNLRNRIKMLRDSFSTNDNATKEKKIKRVFDFQQKDQKKEYFLSKFDKVGEIQNDIDKTWNKLDRAINQNGSINKVIGDEIQYLRKKVNDYQEIVQSAAELCQNSARLINNKNQDLDAIVSEKQVISEELRLTKAELQKLMESKSNIDTAYSKQCTIIDKLQTENETLRDNIRDIQNEFQAEIDSLKNELDTQIRHNKRGIDKNKLDSMLDGLLRQLEIEDDNAKHEISKTMRVYQKKRQKAFDALRL